MVPPVEGEEVQVHGAGGHDAEPGAVADGAGVVQPGGLLGPRRDLHRRGDHRVRQPEVLQPGHGDTIIYCRRNATAVWAPVLQAGPLQRDGVLPAGQGAEPAAGVCPGLGEVELEADLHPREAEAGHRDQGHRHLHLDGVVGALAVLRRAVQTLDPAHNTHSQAATTAEPSVTNVFGLTTEMIFRSSDCACF